MFRELVKEHGCHDRLVAKDRDQGLEWIPNHVFEATHRSRPDAPSERVNGPGSRAVHGPLPPSVSKEDLLLMLFFEGSSESP